MEYDVNLSLKRPRSLRIRWPSLLSVRESLKLWISLGMTVVVGVLLRLWQLDALGFNSDEAVYAGQAAAILGDPELEPFFPMFRAHPMLFHTFLAMAFSVGGVQDVVGRLVAVAFGIINILLVYKIGDDLYNRRVGLLAAFFVALMPYHIIVSRQVLLDGPMTTMATLALYMLVRFGRTQHPVWLYATGAAMGLTFLIKETGIVLLGSIYAFLALAPQLYVRIRDLALSLFCMALVMAAYPLGPRLAGAGGSEKTGNYIIWQLFRRPNHDWGFYLTTVTVAVGPLLIILAIMGLWWFRRRHSWRETLLLAWIVVPTLFFQLWPVKGFHYLLSDVSPLAVLAARPLADGRPGQIRYLPSLYRWRFAIGTIVALSLFFPSWSWVQSVNSDTVMAGGGGVPGGREAGGWIHTHVPEGAVFMTLGPSMANLIQFYGHRQAYGLSVSPNPLHRNPSYQPIRNPDYQLRTGEIQYAVWDSFSATRSSFFERKLLDYVDRYHGRVIYQESVLVTTLSQGAITRQDETSCILKEPDSYECPIIIIYEVRP